MAHTFKVGDHVEWNSEAGRVRGTIKEEITTEITFKGYTVHASKEEPQYLIVSDKTGHQAMHKGSALEKVDGGHGRNREGPQGEGSSAEAHIVSAGASKTEAEGGGGT